MRSYQCNGLVLDAVVAILLEYTPLVAVHASLDVRGGNYSYVEMRFWMEAVSVLYRGAVKNVFRGTGGHND
jgi:hypothetical protein